VPFDLASEHQLRPEGGPSVPAWLEVQLRVLRQECQQLLGDWAVSVLAVGSVGRAHVEAGFSTKRIVKHHCVPEDFDLIVVLDRPGEVRRFLCRRLIGRYLVRSVADLKVPVSVGLIRKSELRRLPFTLFNYEMRNAHRVLLGPDPTPEMPDYDPAVMPLIEATRLLLNRGVLLWGDHLLLRSRDLSDQQLRAIALRNRKVVLALGDALLITSGKYHWSYTQRMRSAGGCLLFDEFKGLGLADRYLAAIAAKLSGEVPETDMSALRSDSRALLTAHERIFGLVEEARLGRRCETWQEYAREPLDYPPYLVRPALKRTVQLWEAFGLPRGNGFYRAHLHRPVEEILLRAFPLLVYTGANGAGFLRRYLNWPWRASGDPASIWQRFSRAWATTQ
jgi:hypothetical protein